MRCVDAAKRVLGWKGVLAEGNAIPRRMVAGMLVLLCVIPIFTQWSYVGILLPSGNDVHLMLMLVPVALAAMLLGTLSGTVAGLLAGTVLYAHSRLYPLDYYELVRVTPVTSVVMTTAFGFVLGVLLSYALGGKHSGLRRMLFVALACLIASCIFSVGCAQELG